MSICCASRVADVGRPEAPISQVMLVQQLKSSWFAQSAGTPIEFVISNRYCPSVFNGDVRCEKEFFQRMEELRFLASGGALDPRS
jgi:hypothetical protein